MMETDIAVVGAGPAGLSAAVHAAKMGASVILMERGPDLGGQLVKQTHKFFGSREEFAGERGFEIARKLIAQIEGQSKIKVWNNATALGYYPDDVMTVKKDDKFLTLKPRRIIVATGASEKTLAFPNNDLPGIYGAGAVQTLMNVHGILPAKRVLMVGAGNIGVIVAYQLLQAGTEVAGIIEAAPKIGGYWVHASKIQRCGVPILTGHTIKQAHGTDHLEGITVCRLDDKWAMIPGTETYYEVDGLCLAVGLSPLTELLWQAGCKMEFVPELGGYVPWRNADLLTTHNNIYVAGDVAGVEEASAAMVEGKLAGLTAAFSLHYQMENFANEYRSAKSQLNALRSAPVSAKVCSGLCKVMLGEAI
ncbi:MAG: NAD(P)/FAD-dependent oxidoreductase [Negativicutes bacterium]